jgi:elongator complex protein 1
LVEYIFETARGSTSPPQDYGAVAVIDGKNIKITPFRIANIPPPAGLHELEVQSHAIDVAFNADSSLVAVLHRQGISLFEWKDVRILSASPSLTGRVTFAKTEDQPYTYQQICFAGGNELLVLRCSASGSVVDRYGFNDETGRIEISSSDEFTTSSVLTLSSSFNDCVSCPFVQVTTSDLLTFTPAHQPLSDCKFPTYLPWVDIAYNPDPIAFGLSGNGHLYANSRLLVKNCTSFLLTPAHLILTTTNHLLKFVHITDVKGK